MPIDIDVTEPRSIDVDIPRRQQGIEVVYGGQTTVINNGTRERLRLVALGNIGGNRVIAIGANGSAIIAEPDNPQHAHLVQGISTGAVSAGATVDVITEGDVVEPSWDWETSRPLFLVANGLLSHSPPTSGYSIQIGVALSPNKIRVKVGLPIFLN